MRNGKLLFEKGTTMMNHGNFIEAYQSDIHIDGMEVRNVYLQERDNSWLTLINTHFEANDL